MLNLTDAFALGRLDAHDQAALVRQGELAVADLAEAALLRIEALDPALRATSHFAPELARSRAAQLARDQGPSQDSPMRGVPWMPKDSLDYPGMPTRSCSRSRTGALAHGGYPFTARLDAAGLVAVGKTSMPEFGLLGSTEPLAGPIPRNPWSLAHSPGGSSGGAGAAVAAGLVPFAQGSDGGGSIRLPASCCGIVGLKPGRDATVRVRSRHNVEDLLVGDSLMSRSVRDTAWAFAATHLQPDRPMVRGPSTRRLRIAVIENGLRGAAPHADVASTIRRTADLCAALGHHVEAAQWPIDGGAFLQSFEDLWTHLGADCVDAVRAASGGRRLEDLLEPWTLALGRRAETLPTTALEAAFRQLAGLPVQLSAFFADYDVVLSPVAATPPPLLGTYAPSIPADTLMTTMFEWIAYTPLQNLGGTPAISLPLFSSPDGLPVGSQFAADRGQEDLLLALAYELEVALPWQARWPSVSVATPPQAA
ncbi:amidase [Pseudoduganella lurida]|uniref:Amidase n=1 Tax=Pseudoduganella lurida TaxID=1036180 RepID=A0A562REB3_9BURK|nr:amidase family protein [Pseudoduganella lurida]TWI67405.1 amidase [Pseudoduganella lurida]